MKIKFDFQFLSCLDRSENIAPPKPKRAIVSHSIYNNVNMIVITVGVSDSKPLHGVGIELHP